MKIRPVHHAVLTYAEWCCDNALPWPKMVVVAYDLHRDLTDVQRAMGDLVAWGLVSERYGNNGLARILRLGDGRETSPFCSGNGAGTKNPAGHGGANQETQTRC